MAKFPDSSAGNAFPQLREILDAGKLRQMLQQCWGPAVPNEEWQIENCVIDDTHYKPGGACSITFFADLRRRDRAERHRQIFFGKLLPEHKAQKRGKLPDQDGMALSKFGPPVFNIPEWQMTVWAYPNDPVLSGLPAMADSEKILKLAQAAPEKFGLSGPPQSAAAEMTKYVAGARCGYIYQMQLPGAGAARVYGKIYGKGKGEGAYDVMKGVWQSPGSQRGDFILPQPYSYDPDLQILWQEVFAGRPFAKIAETIPNLPEVAEEIGARLAAFHNCRLPLPVEMTFDFQIQNVRESVENIGRAFPDYAGRVSSIGQRLINAAAQLGAGPLTPVHASFKFSHIFATEKGIGFIDFDGANLGDPGFDVGRFIAHLYKIQTHGRMALPMAEQTATNFCRAYNRAAASPLPPERVNWFVASHLMSSEIYKAVKNIETSPLEDFLPLVERFFPA